MMPNTDLIQSTIENELLLESWIGVILDRPIMKEFNFWWHKIQDILRKDYKKMGNIFYAYLVFISLWVPGARLTSTKASGFPPSKSALAKFWYVYVIWIDILPKVWSLDQMWCDLPLQIQSWTYPPLEHPEDETLGLVVVVDPVLQLGRSSWGLRLGLGLLIWRAESSFHGLARWLLWWWL